MGRIAINFADATLESNTLRIVVSAGIINRHKPGGTIVATSINFDDYIQDNYSITLTTSDDAGGALTGLIEFWLSISQDPTLTVSGFAGGATVTWGSDAEGGLGTTATLEPGTTITLAQFPP